jgi:hypothetical protein
MFPQVYITRYSKRDLSAVGSKAVTSISVSARHSSVRDMSCAAMTRAAGHQERVHQRNRLQPTLKHLGFRSQRLCCSIMSTFIEHE